MYRDAIIFLLPVADVVVVVAAVLASRRSRKVPALRAFWLAIAFAWSAEFLADALLVHNDVILDQPRFPSPADPFFLAFYPLLLLALLRAPRMRTEGSERMRVFLDCALIVVGGGTAIWYFVLGPTILDQGGQGTLATAISIAYPLGDLIALSALATVMLRQTDRRLRTPLRFIAAGLVLLIVADTAYGYLQIHGIYSPGDPVDVLYLLLVVPFFLAARSQQTVPAGASIETDPIEPRIASPLPYVGMAIGFAFLVWVEWGQRFFPDFSLLLFAVAVAVLGVLRQLLTQREQRRMAEALRESEALFRGIYANAGIGIAISTFVGGRPEILDVNPAFARMMGYSPEELRGNDFSMITPPEHLGSLAEMSEAIRTGRDVIGREQPSLRKDGSVIYGSLTVSVIRDEDGAPKLLVGAIEDVTERRAAEQAKDEFVSIVGHELRTPLTSIRGSLGLLQAGVVGEVSGEAEDMIDTAVASTDRLVRLINDVLDLERMESGQIQPHIEAVGLKELVNQSFDVVGAIAAEAGIELHAEVPNLYLQADGDRLVQTLTNLLANAIKFSERGQEVGVEIAAEGEQVRIIVVDHGRGIPADQLEAIFERFSQVDASDARERGGTGLGLAIARQIVEGHGGRIWAESDPTDGTRVQFTVPLATVPAEVIG